MTRAGAERSLGTLTFVTMYLSLFMARFSYYQVSIYSTLKYLCFEKFATTLVEMFGLVKCSLSFNVLQISVWRQKSKKPSNFEMYVSSKKVYI